MSNDDINTLIKMLARLPGLGGRSAQRIALHLIERKETYLSSLIEALTLVQDRVQTCHQCGNLDSQSPCAICKDHRRDPSIICVVQGVADLWALERTGSFSGRYHILGGVLSAIEGVGPEDLRIGSLLGRIEQEDVQEVILALSATVDGQATSHYIVDQLDNCDVKITKLARGVPVGGELDYLDDGTLVTALNARSSVD